MSASGRPAHPGRDGRRIELQLDTAQIVLVLAMLVALCAASFYLGRWIERDRWSGIEPTRGPGRIVASSAATDLTFFDTLGSGTAEPGRQVRAPIPKPATPAAPAPPAPPAEASHVTGSTDPIPATPQRTESPAATTTSGGFLVQVFSGDRVQAEKIAGSLARKGYSARAIPVSPGSKTSRVRVFGYPTRAEAERAASRLEKEERLRPWVVKAD